MGTIPVRGSTPYRGRPQTTKKCPACERIMSAREFHDHPVADCLENAKFQRIWDGGLGLKVTDPRYYDRDIFSPIQSSLSTVWTLNMRS
jgi:hypothetical protein